MKSKDLFLMMREQEIQTSNFLPTKKEIQKSAKDFIEKLLDSGECNKFELLAQAKRISEALDIVTSKLIEILPSENFEEFGIKGTFRNGGDTKNFKDCEMWQDISRKLKEREALLLTALKSKYEIYDEEGVLVPKISTTPRKDSVSISF